jgi:hypothetical protein
VRHERQISATVPVELDDPLSAADDDDPSEDGEDDDEAPTVSVGAGWSGSGCPWTVGSIHAVSVPSL